MKFLVAAIILILGYIFREETLIINIGDTYYVATYFTLSIYSIYGLITYYLIKFLYKKCKC